MSAPAAAQSVSDVAVTDATDTADRPASRTLAQVGRWARRVPFTIGVVALILVLGLVGEGWWRRVDRASWFPDIAYGLPPLREAKVWTPITGMPFGLTPAHYVTMTIAFAVLVGWAEWRLGIRADGGRRGRWPGGRRARGRGVPGDFRRDRLGLGRPACRRP